MEGKENELTIELTLRRSQHRFQSLQHKIIMDSTQLKVSYAHNEIVKTHTVVACQVERDFEYEVEIEIRRSLSDPSTNVLRKVN